MDDLSIAALEARLNKHAAAIRELRTQVRDLQAQVRAAPASTSSPAAAEDTDGTAWAPPAHCLTCSTPKGAGRETVLTCAPCGKKRNDIIYRRKGDISDLITTACGYCGSDKKENSNILCPPCSKRYAEYRDAQSP